jgi:hypothetical protein
LRDRRASSRSARSMDTTNVTGTPASLQIMS